MRFTPKKHFLLFGAVGLAIILLAAVSFAQFTQDDNQFGRFRLSSTTFSNDSILPISTIHNIVSNGKNVCSIDGSTGGNQSPELSWSGAPQGTRSFVVTTYDVTAAFTHWGMYNISGHATELPENAGVPGSPYGPQIVNDFGNAEYDGPCPPANVPPDLHHYVFTVYALDIDLALPGFPNFPANAETLYQALIVAGESHHILATATITGLYSTTPSAQ